MQFKDLLVVVPHSGVLIPNEISLDSLSNEFPKLMRNVDWYTNWLYDFRDILGNSQLTFSYCSLILEANRHPESLEDSVPLKDILGEPIYRHGREPDRKLRQSLSRQYLRKFHRDISTGIARGKTFMLDGHSTMTAQGIADNQIELMNFQAPNPDGKPTYFCPDIFIETYANQLAKMLPEINVTVNESRYGRVYGHVCGEHSINAMRRVGNRVPAILQETNQKLYMYADRTPNVEAVETLRRTFAQALYQMSKKVPIPR